MGEMLPAKAGTPNMSSLGAPASAGLGHPTAVVDVRIAPNSLGVPASAGLGHPLSITPSRRRQPSPSLARGNRRKYHPGPMGPSVVIFFSATVVSVLFVGLGWGMTYRLAYPSERKKVLRPLLVWTIRGVVLPGIIWILMNIGLSWNLQPFMPDVQWAQNSGKPWFPDYLEVVGRGFFLISSYWAAITLAWSLWSAARKADRETLKSFKSLCWTCFLGMIIPSVGIALLGGLPLAGLAAIALIGPLGVYGPSVLVPAKTPPMYARAIARMKFGK